MAAQFPMVQQYCSCTTPFGDQTELASKQRIFEELIRSGLSFVEVMNKLEITRMCCRRSFMNMAHLFLNTAGIKRFVEENPYGHKKITIDTTSQNHKPEEIKPKRELPSIPV